MVAPVTGHTGTYGGTSYYTQEHVVAPVTTQEETVVTPVITHRKWHQSKEQVVTAHMNMPR